MADCDAHLNSDHWFKLLVDISGTGCILVSIPDANTAPETPKPEDLIMIIELFDVLAFTAVLFASITTAYGLHVWTYKRFAR